MLARSGLAGNKSSWPYLGPSEAIFSMDLKNPKNVNFLPIFPLVGPYKELKKCLLNAKVYALYTAQAVFTLCLPHK